jgi:hypothetical protein
MPNRPTGGLIRAIEDAWREVARPENDRLLHPRCRDDNDIAWLYPIDHWADLVTADLEPDYASLSFLSPEGFRYFLPVYLIWSLRHLDSDSVVLDSLAFHFTPGPPHLEEFRQSKYSTFSQDQLQLVEATLDLIRAVRP